MKPPRKSPTLSIVIPTFDTRELTLRCLASLQELPSGTEVVVVDDGSTDGTSEAIASRPSAPCRIVRHESPQGFSRAANRGYAETTGEIVWVLNSDTEVEPEAVTALLEAFRRDPELAVAGAALTYPDGRPQWSGGPEPTPLWLFAHASGLGERWGRWRRSRRPTEVGVESLPRGPVSVDWVTGAAIAIRRAAVQKLSAAALFDERFRFYAQDLDLCVRLRAAGGRIRVLPDVRVRHHHGATISKAKEASASRQLELLWADLLDWAALGGRRKGRRAAWALVFGAGVRQIGRAIARPFVSSERLTTFHQEDLALSRARSAVRRFLSERA